MFAEVNHSSSITLFANFCIKMFRTVILDPGLFQMAFTCSSSTIKTTEECL